jgi:hypothetical protein
MTGEEKTDDTITGNDDNASTRMAAETGDDQCYDMSDCGECDTAPCCETFCCCCF